MTEIPDVKADPVGFIMHLRRGAERGRRLAAARPGWNEIGTELARLHNEFVESVWGSGPVNRLSGRPLTPLPTAFGHSAGTPHVNNSNEFFLRVSHTYVTGVRDHLGAIALLATGAASPRSILAMCRIVLDASAHSAFLLDPVASERVRLSRAINLELESLRQEIGDPAFGSSESPSAKDRRSELMDVAIRAGFEQSVRNKPEWKVVPVVGPGEALRHVLGEGAELPWRHLSSAAHVQERSIVRFGVDLDVVSAGPHAESATINHGVPAVLALIEAIRAIEQFYGSMGNPVAQETIERALLVTSFGAGHHDGILKSRLDG